MALPPGLNAIEAARVYAVAENNLNGRLAIFHAALYGGDSGEIAEARGAAILAFKALLDASASQRAIELKNLGLGPRRG